MTDKPTPTDAELNTILRTHWPAFARQSALVEIWVRDALQDAIDKLGPPDQKTVTVAPATGDMWLKHDDDLRYVRRVLEAGRQMTDVDQRAAIDIVQGLRVTARSMAVDAKKPAQAEEPVAGLDPWTGTKVTTDYDAYGKHGIPLYTAPQPVAREPLPKFLALKFHARRDKKATVTLLFPGHEAADAWVRGIKGGQHVS